MAQVLAKEYECLTCHKSIKISKIDNPAPGQKKKWERFDLDEVTPHECANKKTEPTSASRTSGHFWVPRGIKMGSENTGALRDAQRRTLSYGSYGDVQNPRIGDIVLNSNHLFF